MNYSLLKIALGGCRRGPSTLSHPCAVEGMKQATGMLIEGKSRPICLLSPRIFTERFVFPGIVFPRTTVALVSWHFLMLDFLGICERPRGDNDDGAMVFAHRGAAQSSGGGGPVRPL